MATHGNRSDDGGRSLVRGSRKSVMAGLLFGVGLAAFVDEAVFHQLLHWHHFYDKATSQIGLVSDGILHGFSWFATVYSLFLLINLSRRRAVYWRVWLAGLLVGAGAFQLYDGTINHKLLGLHQIRYDVDLLPYDLAWNITAAVLMLAGVALGMRARSTARRHAP